MDEQARITGANCGIVSGGRPELERFYDPAVPGAGRPVRCSLSRHSLCRHSWVATPCVATLVHTFTLLFTP